MSSLLMQAAQSAAAADGLVPPTDAGMSKASSEALQQARSAIARGPKKKGPPLRRGKWTPEEEAYANRLIQEFKAGLLPLTDGTTLRTFLSKLLNCDPMRISKKFVGSNCIGKQVFRRRNADLNRLTPEQIQQSRAELSELERRFLERVAQTNRVKSSGVGGGAGGAAAPGGATASAAPPALEEKTEAEPPSPPWLQPPLGYKHGQGAAFAANSRAAAAGRALLSGNHSLKEALERKQQQQQQQQQQQAQLSWSGSAGLLAMAEMQQRASQSNLFGSSSNLLRSGLSAAQLNQNASAARLAGLASNSSMNSLMLKTGLSRDQLNELARNRGLSSESLSNMIQRQNSFDALMSLDFQSLQSIDNLANLMQTNASSAPGSAQMPETGLKNADFGMAAARPSNEDLSMAARRLASAGRMESLLKTMSSNNVAGNGSSANLDSFLQRFGNGAGSAASLLGGNHQGQSAVSLANLLRQDSSTGLTALRMQDGLNPQRNSSVDDFLSLVAAGDIPHQDPNMLNVPLMHQQQQQAGGQEAAAKLLAQQHMLQQASSNAALANALASRSFGNFSSGNLATSPSAAALFMAQARAADSKRKLDDMNGTATGQGQAKR